MQRTYAHSDSPWIPVAVQVSCSHLTLCHAVTRQFFAPNSSIERPHLRASAKTGHMYELSCGPNLFWQRLTGH